MNILLLMEKSITYKKNQLIYQVDIRTANSDSVFLYYTLEALGHLCFYSTLNFEKSQQYRDVRIQSTIELKPQLQAALQSLCQEISLEFLSEKEITD